jgi:RNA polymerase sigma-70 factor (ECF subfamily)
MLRLRYSDGLAIEVIARRLERTEEAVYRALSRIRRALHECVSRAQLLEGRS